VRVPDSRRDEAAARNTRRALEDGMDLELQGKTAIVTGASQGIGHEIARQLHGEGVALVLVARHGETLSRAARSIASDRSSRSTAPVHPIAADLTLRAEVERVAEQAIARLGAVNVLVNNAGRARTGGFFELREEDLQEVWQVKAFGYVRMVRALAPHMKDRKSGSIINIVGSTGRTPTQDFIVGSMVNAALVNFTRGMARELAPFNVRINSISPGWTLTERLERSLELQAGAQGVTLDEMIRREARGIPLNRLVVMQEVARLTLLLASDQLPSMTGEDIIVDGGVTPSV
jgi:NAD(P)-dependent dehydrogenase (short-subunit alcohol dehydrogenase family)